MGNRKQPFGYKMEFGEIVPQPQEAETVRSIYLQYLAGASFKQLAERLQTEDVPYDGDKPWNKNMVARILEDDRYIGEKHFPALIPTEQFHAAQERRKEMRPEYKQTPAQKELRRLCGGIVPDSVARKVLKILNQVVDDPQLIKIESSGVPTTEDIRQRRLELDKLLQTPPVDEEIAPKGNGVGGTDPCERRDGGIRSPPAPQHLREANKAAGFGCKPFKAGSSQNRVLR